MFIDTHAHLMSKDYEGDFEDVLKRAREVGVGRIINVSYDIESSNQSIYLSEKYEQCFAVIGVHPYDSAVFNDEIFEKFKKLALENKKIVAIGECGLDFFKCDVPVDLQKKVFREQIKLALETGLPLIIHSREADKDTLAILDEFIDGDIDLELGNGIGNSEGAMKGLLDFKSLKIVFHCFSGNLDFARKLWDRGFYTSFTGNITFPKADNIREVALNMPLDKFMIETDCPWLAPQDVRGQRCEPSHVVSVAKKIAEVRGMSLEEIGKISSENALKFFDRMK